MPKSTLSGLDEATEMLLQSARQFQQGSKIVPARYQAISLRQMLDYLLINWADHKGNAATVYGSIGNSSALTGGFDFGILVCPGIVSLSVNATAKLKETNDTILIIHRCMPERWVSHQGRLQIGSKLIRGMSVDKPAAFMVMQGTSREYSLKLAIAASVGSGVTPIPLNGFGFTLGGGEVSGEIARRVFRYYDNKPGWYDNSRNALLLEDFSNSLGTRTTHYLKREIVNWLNFIRKDLKSFLAAPLNKDLKKEFDSLPKFRFRNASERAVNDKLRDLLTAVENLWVSTNTSKALKDKLQQYQKELSAASKATGEYIYKPKKGWNVDRQPISNLCQITLVNWKKEGTIKISVGNNPVDGGLGGGSGAGTNLASDPTLDSFANDRLIAASTFNIPTITIGGGITLKYKRVSTNFRYQTYAFSSGEERIVYTQDVKILYTEKDVTAAVQAGLDALAGRNVDLSGVHVLGKELSGVNKVKTNLLKGKELWGKRSMYYRSVAAYWKYSNDDRQKYRETYNGSGISFGISIRMQDLIRLSIIENGGSTPEFMEQELGEYARLLRVKVEEFRTFLKSFLVEDKELGYENEVSGFEKCMEYGAVLVESNFRFTESVKIFMAKRDDGSRSRSTPGDLTIRNAWKKFFEGDSTSRQKAGVQLEAMRIRLRLGDHTSSSKNIFRLGFYLFGSGFGFNLDKIKAAGNEGILDLHLHHFLPFDQNITRYAKTLRDGVPPVMLIPHHFNE